MCQWSTGETSVDERDRALARNCFFRLYMSAPMRSHVRTERCVLLSCVSCLAGLCAAQPPRGGRARVPAGACELSCELWPVRVRRGVTPHAPHAPTPRAAALCA